MATSASQWKKKVNVNHELPLPSGNVALVRRPGMQAFITEGVIPNSLLQIIMGKLEEAGAQQPFNPQDVMGDFQNSPEKLADLMDLVDSVVVYCVVDPEVHPINFTPDDVFIPPEGLEGMELPPGKCRAEEVGQKIPARRRIDDVLYTDNVDMDDKFAVFNYAVGGTGDLERFREGSAAVLASSQSMQAVDSSAE